ncbi:MAG: M13 family metallopeptidase [Ferruginibacter sp.]
MKPVLILISSILFLYSCRPENTQKPDVVAANVDTTVQPADDFFQFANGGWIKRNPIPDEQSSWGIGNLVIEENQKRLREICERAAADSKNDDPSLVKIGQFWASGMDSVSIEKNGLKPLQPLLNKIDSIQDVPSLLQVGAILKKNGSSTLFSDYVGQDAMNSDKMAYQLYQGGIGLPEREYYFKTDSSTIRIQAAYKKYIQTILTLSGMPATEAGSAAAAIFAMETELARSHRKLEDLRDPYKNYNKMTVLSLNKLTPAFQWEPYLQTYGITQLDTVIVGQPEFYQALSQQLSKTTLSTWKMYLRFNLLSDMAGYLPDAYGQASFEFNKQFSGAKQRKARWKRVIQAEENAMGELMGKYYVSTFFNEKAKARYTKMVVDVKEALRHRIERLTWMSDSTKQKAYEKLNTMKSKVGYPDTWKNFSAMNISNNSYVINYMNSRQWWHAYEIAKIGKPVNRDEWSMYPQTYNAYYNPSNNEIVLPAGIFTIPGYLDEEVDDAVVYGYGGASTIGHEITHGFDDEGRQFDAQGNLKSWWSASDEETFRKRADVMIRQFDAFEPIKGYHINGKATLGENIADLGGILLGYEAFTQTNQFKENKSIAGYTPAQRFFMGYALGWLGHIRDEQLKNYLMTDVHSPAKYRVNGPFSSTDPFYQAFSVTSTNRLYLPDSLRVRIW